VVYVLCLVPPTHEIKVISLGKKDAPGATVKSVELLNGQPPQWDRDEDGLKLRGLEKPENLPVVFKVTLEGSLLGGLLVQPSTSGFSVNGTLQNYGEGSLVQNATLRVASDRISQPVTVQGMGTQNFQIDYLTSAPGLYEVSLGMEDQGSLNSRATLPLLDLSGEWLFQKGDDASWSNPGIDDSKWQKVQVPSQWADLGYKCDNCFGWYRKKIFIPAEWKGHAIVLPLGKIDDSDEAYFNGVKIGQTGEFPPNFQGHWDWPRKYEVPADKVKFGADNVIAVRVYNGTGGAGIYDGPLSPIEVK
jgi:hypothetical protein